MMSRDVKFVDVRHRDGESPGVETSVVTGGTHGDVVAGRRLRIERSVDGHDAGCRVDREQSARIVVQRVADVVRHVWIVRKQP